MLIATLLTKTARSEPEPASDFIPGVPVNKGTPDEMRCYDLENYKLLLELDNERQECLVLQPLFRRQIMNQQTTIESLNEQISSNEIIVKTLEYDRDRYKNMWIEENRARHEAEETPRFGSALPWAIATVAGIVAVGAVTYAVLE